MSDDTATQDDPATAQDEADSAGSAERVAPGEVELSESEIEEIEQERQRRTAPENRPDGAEVDNTDRDFDPIQGKFEDSDTETDGPYNPPGEG
jgi:hypothetical protein